MGQLEGKEEQRLGRGWEKGEEGKSYCEEEGGDGEERSHGE